MVSAVKLSKKGRRRGGKPLSRGALYCLLSNRIYRGEIRHKQQSHLGQHEPIMSRVECGLFSTRAVRDTSREELRPTPQLGMSRRNAIETAR
jgi:hypothetical protein